MNDQEKEISLEKQALETLAEEIFMDISGLKRIKERDPDKFEMMLEDALDAKELILDRIDAKNTYRYFEDCHLKGQHLTIEDVTLTCAAFEQIEPEMVEGVYLYALSLGNFSIPDEDMMEQLYADFWGTAYTDALRLLMKQEFEKEGMLSNSFGPGFYGMAVTEMGKLEQLLDFRRIGTEVKNYSILVPEKSCAGVLFRVNDTYQSIGAACETCMGNHMSCRMCRQNSNLSK